MRYNIELLRCSRSCEEYKQIRDRHYVPNHGAIGQQLHYLIVMDFEVIGIISGGASAYQVQCRDDFFGINADNRQVALNGIVDNTVFRLEKHLPNLGTQVLKMWRERVCVDWKRKYGVNVCGFETFVIEDEHRKGSMYKADNWTFVGETKGSSKAHAHGISNIHHRVESEKKLVFCKRIEGVELPKVYYSNWRNQSIVRGQISMFEEGGVLFEQP